MKLPLLWNMNVINHRAKVYPATIWIQVSSAFHLGGIWWWFCNIMNKSWQLWMILLTTQQTPASALDIESMFTLLCIAHRLCSTEQEWASFCLFCCTNTSNVTVLWTQMTHRSQSNVVFANTVAPVLAGSPRGTIWTFTGLMQENFLVLSIILLKKWK